MPRILCHVRYRMDRVSFVWSDGEKSFRPYHLTGTSLDDFRRWSQQCAERSGFALAQAGHELFRAIFAGQDALREWVTAQQADSLELVSDAPGGTPWAAVYGQSPDEGGFAGNHPEAWRPFWGVRFALASGSRASVWRQLPVLDEPRVVAIIDSALRTQLPETEQRRLQDLLADRGIETIAGRAGLLEGPSEVADIVYVFAAAHPHGFTLEGEPVTAAELRDALMKSPGSSEPVLFANLVGGPGPLLNTFNGFAAALGPVGPVEAAAANSFGLQVLEDVLSRGETVAAVLQTLRGQTPYPGLLYEARCPADLRVLQAAQAGDVPQPPRRPLPEHPYRPFAPYDHEHQALFGGRDQDLGNFTALLDRAQTRILVLHGASSVGKTSFLQASVLPFVEDSTVGLKPLRDRNEDDAESMALVLRSSGDLLGQLAAGLCAFCARPLTHATPAGESVTVDLPGILASFLSAGNKSSSAIREQLTSVQSTPPPMPTGDAATESPAPAPGVTVGQDSNEDTELWAVLRHRPETFGELIAAISAQLPFELLIIVDQAEELFTQVDSGDRQLRRMTLEMMKRAARGDCKFIVSLRRDYAAELLHDLPPVDGVCEYLLEPLTAQQIAEAIVLPTASEAILFSSEIAYSKYGFQYADGVPKIIARDALRAAADRQVGVLPIVQCLCARLAELAANKPDHIIRESDIKPAGGVDDAVVNYFERKLNSLPLPRRTRTALRNIMPVLYSQHPDGTLTLDLVAAPDLKTEWKDTYPIQDAVHVAAKDDDGLFDIERLVVDGTRGLYVTLKQDALAQADLHAQQRKSKASASTTWADILWIGVPLVLLALALTYFWRQSNIARADLEQEVQRVKLAKEAADRQQATVLYGGALARAAEAWEAGNVDEMQRRLLDTDAQMRAFDFYYLWHEGHRYKYFPPQPKTVVTSIAIPANGEHVAACESNGLVKVFNLKELAKSNILLLSGTNLVAFDEDGKTLVTATSDGKVAVWDREKLPRIGEPMTTPQHSFRCDGPVLAVDVDRQLAAAVTGADITLWDLTKGEKRGELKGHEADVRVVRFSPDGSLLASADVKGNVHIWKATGEKAQSIQAKNWDVKALTFSPDAKLLAVSGSERKLDVDVGVFRLWKVADGSPALAVIEQGPEVSAVNFTPDGKSVLTAGDPPYMVLRNVEDGTEAGQLRGQYGRVVTSAFAKDGSIFAIGDYTGLRIWRTSEYPELFNFAPSPIYNVVQAHAGAVTSVVCNRDLTYIATAGVDGEVKLWDENGRMQFVLPKAENPVAALALHAQANGARLAVSSVAADGMGVIEIWQLSRKDGAVQASQQRKLTSVKAAVYGLAFSPDGKILAAAGADKNVYLLDPEADKEIRTLQGNTKPVRAVAFSLTGKKVGAGGDDGTLRVWDVKSGRLDETFRPKRGSKHFHEDGITAIVFYGLAVEDQVREVIVTASMDGGSVEWDLGRHESTWRYKGHAGGVSSLVLSGDRAILSGSWDHTIKSFDTQNGQERFTFAGHRAAVQCLALGGDPRVLISGDRDGVLRFWRSAAVPREVEPEPE